MHIRVEEIVAVRIVKVSTFTTMARAFDAEVVRDGRWWMIHVPELDAVPQARHEGEIDRIARSLIAVSTGLPPAQISVKPVPRRSCPGEARPRAAPLSLGRSRELPRRHPCSLLQACFSSGIAVPGIVTARAPPAAPATP